ncbi:m-phase inducer phosphatase [Recurvomyces mirabilis]|nr:m-phase inducer phosphatase [Recurvomyces mirabilis]
MLTPPIEVDSVITPPIPSSSPGLADMMELSPLPHKAPYFMAQVTLPSPSQEETPDGEGTVSADLLSPPLESFPVLQPQVPIYLALPERRRPVTRPSLTRRAQYHSSAPIPQRPFSAETSLPPFRFGSVTNNGISCASTPSLLGKFTDSPVEDMSTSSTPTMPPPPRRPSLGASSRTTGSPIGGHVRKPSAGRASSFVRPQRKVMRRSLSMFQHPDDVMKEEQDAFEGLPGLASVMDIDQAEPQLKLPNFTSENEPDGLPRISQECMVDILEGKYRDQYTNVKVIDCRFEYEYTGGHIDGAINFNDKQALTHELFDAPCAESTLLLFHCEYSVHRAPLTAKHIRGHDRNVNAANYPRLTYPEMYILDGGYSKFFQGHRSKCFPQNYVEMNDQRHEQDCERGMAKVKSRAKLIRAQTFAFGQNDMDAMDDSPTAQGRTAMPPRAFSSFQTGMSLSDGIGQSFARRMASY